jgi:SAM-dependent methyltransferase
VLGVDASQAFVEHARVRVSDARVRFVTADAEQLPVPDAAFEVAVSGLVLNFVARPEQAVLEMARAVRSGGSVAAYVWDYAGKMELMRYFWDAAVALDPGALELDEGRRFPICRPDRFAQLFRNELLSSVETRAIDVVTRFTDFDDYFSPFLGGQGPAPSYVAKLDEHARAALRERLRATLPAGAHGSIELVARAWAARARRG